jgi:hypothetical protein
MDDDTDRNEGADQQQSTDEPVESGALEEEQQGKGYGAGGREQLEDQ